MFKRTPKFSNAIAAELLPDELCDYGLAGDVVLVAYDPLLSLFAVATSKHEIHILGYGATKNTLRLEAATELVHISFVRGIYLVAVSKDGLVQVFALDKMEIWNSGRIPGRVHSCYTDLTIDWLFLGLESGQVAVYDIDRGGLVPFRIDNVQKQLEPTGRLGAVLQIAIHPLDLGRILLCYNRICAVFNVSDNSIYSHCDAKDVPGSNREYFFTAAQWHPSGTHIALTTSTGSITWWDAEKGQFLSEVAAGPTTRSGIGLSQHSSVVQWGCSSDPNETFLAASFGNEVWCSSFGVTPMYTTTSYSKMGRFYSSSKVAKLALPGIVKQIVLLPSSSPFYGGGHNTRAMAVLTEKGTVSVYDVPDFVLSQTPSRFLPPALLWAASPTTYCAVTTAPRINWQGMSIAGPKPFVHGGPQQVWRPRRTPQSSVVLRGSRDGSVQLYDGIKALGPDYRVLETSILGLYSGERDYQISNINFAGETAELACSTGSGNVYLFSYSKASKRGPELDLPLVNLANSDNKVGECFRPRFLVLGQAPVTCLKQSEIGFVAIGYADGRLVICDRRGPSILLDTKLPAVPTCFAFSILGVQDQPYSSLSLAVGDSRGGISQFVIIPAAGKFRVEPLSQQQYFKEPVIYMCAVDLSNGRSAEASPAAFGDLFKGGPPCLGGLIASSAKEVRLVPVSKIKKSYHKSLNTPVDGVGFMCLRDGDALGFGYVCKGKLRLLSIPDFSTVSTLTVQPGRGHLNLNGDLLVESSPYNATMFGLTGVGAKLTGDNLVPETVQIPMRPTISTISWLVGQIYVRPEDLDMLMGGARRLPAKRVNNVQKSTDMPAGSPKPHQSGHPHRASTATSGQKTWAQTFDDYYDSAENTVNDTLDGWMDSLNSKKKDATSMAVKGVIWNKLGL